MGRDVSYDHHDLYNIFGNVTSTWVGSDDGYDPRSGEGQGDGWSPTNNASPSDMVETSASVYDNGGVGDGNLTESITFPVAPASGASNAKTFQVTAMYYDWRDRQVATKQGALVEQHWQRFQGAGWAPAFSRWASTPATRARRTTMPPAKRSITNYQGQVLGGSSPWTFRNVTPNSQAVYDVYVSGSTDKTQGDYTIGGTAGGTSFTLPSSAWGTDATAPTTVGAGWLLVGAVTVPSNATAVSVTYGTGTPPTSLPPAADHGHGLRRQRRRDRHDRRDGPRHGQFLYDALGDNVADYEGRMLAVTGSSGTVTFQSTSPQLPELVQRLHARRRPGFLAGRLVNAGYRDGSGPHDLADRELRHRRHGADGDLSLTTDGDHHVPITTATPSRQPTPTAMRPRSAITRWTSRRR